MNIEELQSGVVQNEQFSLIAHKHRILLVECPQLPPREDQMSWQKYTSIPPVVCSLHLDAADEAIRVIPLSQLKYDTSYGILLEAGVPMLPASGKNATLFDFCYPPIATDYIQLFKTMTEQQFTRYSRIMT